ncbi:MAG: hypothetical protein U9N81_01180 [Bacillota bacterium]|nr:hypothetical protein [Bacillota bacterium]
MIRQDKSAELMIYCSSCGNSYNEYNWTLETGAMYSKNKNTVPTLLDLLIQCLAGDKEVLQTAFAVCPSCHEKVFLRNMRMPTEEEIRAYAEKVGQDYRINRY